jgi:methylenetetrahydrofolate dehydrogenase (NADP+)/methenyltetrahydrofolate cyclohydrolase
VHEILEMPDGEAQLIDGKSIAAKVRREVARDVQLIKVAGIFPGLAVVLVGDDPASQVYVRNKAKAASEVGIASFEHRLSADTPEDALLGLIRDLNSDDAVHGILVQFPVPPHIEQRRVIEEIDPAKDVDGLHPINVGRLQSGLDTLVPCTPQGCLILIKSVQSNISGLDAIVIGRSSLVGKPVAQLLLAENCTVTMAHSRTTDLQEKVSKSDILVAAVGRPHFVSGSWIKPGAIVIDVGINRVVAEDGGVKKTKLVGDVEIENAKFLSRAITPVPGGVGPMTVACLMRNTLIAARRLSGCE